MTDFFNIIYMTWSRTKKLIEPSSNVRFTFRRPNRSHVASNASKHQVWKILICDDVKKIIMYTVVHELIYQPIWWEFH